MAVNVFSDDDIQFLSKIDSLCEGFAATASQADQSGSANEFVVKNVRALAKTGFFCGGTSKEYGGLALPEPVRKEATERLAAACGVTAFAQAQLHNGCNFIGPTSDETLKREYLPKFANGAVLCGVSFAHVRRSGPPTLTAKKIDGGYVLNGHAPWISDWSFLDSYILAGIIEPSNEVLYTYVNKHETSDYIVASDAMQLAVMTGADTVSLQCTNLVIDDRFVLSIKEPGHMKRSDYCNITGHVTLPLGCARGSVAFMRSLGTSIAERAADRFQVEIDDCREQSLIWNSSRADDEGYRNAALKTRSSAVNIALRAAEASIAASGGRAHLLTHPAQRRLREAAFYSTMAQTADTQGALLETFTDAC